MSQVKTICYGKPRSPLDLGSTTCIVTWLFMFHTVQHLSVIKKKANDLFSQCRQDLYSLWEWIILSPSFVTGEQSSVSIPATSFLSEKQNLIWSRLIWVHKIKHISSQSCGIQIHGSLIASAKPDFCSMESLIITFPWGRKDCKWVIIHPLVFQLSGTLECMSYSFILVFPLD